MVFLQGYGVSPAFAARIYKKYGAAAIARVRENPYRLAFDVWGIGFLSADKLAAALGVARDAPSRAEAGVRHVLDEEGGNGHVFVPRPRLAQKAAALLDLPEESADAAIDRLAQAGRRRAGRVGGRGRARARRLRGRASTGPRPRWRPGCASCSPRPRPGWRSIEARALAWYEKRGRHRAGAPAGRGGRRPRSPAKVAVITGGPGVGKTTIVRGIVSILGEEGRDASRSRRRRGAPPSGSRTRPACRRRRCTACSSGGPPRASFARNAARPLEADVADRRRGVDGRRPAGRRSGRRAAAVDAPRAGGRRRSAAVGRAGDGAGATSSPAAPCRSCG